MNDKDLRKNASGCSDPTAYEAIKNIDKEDERFQKLIHTIFNMCELSGPTAYEAIRNVDVSDDRFHKLLHTIFDMCELSGFRLAGRITLVDQETGKVYK